MHISDGIYMDHERYEGDHHHHHGGQLINQKSDLQWKVATYAPGINNTVVDVPTANIHIDNNGQRKSERNAEYGDTVRADATDYSPH